MIVGLLLLMVLTVFGASAMNTATLQLVMSSNAQFYQEAFQAAETGIDLAVARRTFSLESPTVVPVTPLGEGGYSTQAVATFAEATPVPDRAFSLGEGSAALQAFHFDIAAVGTGPRNAVSTHHQSFYVLGPGSP